ncbi:MAG: DUF4860 domain-containing protein [Alphaproteobacteria bacterium]|nr:DUF4860 domain-containing protein [Alphaproteobacteria bacterium]
MNRKNLLNYAAGALFVFTLSAICTLVLTITDKSAQANDALVNEQLVTSFVTEKIKRAQKVEVTKNEGRDILILKDGSQYVTYLYSQSGYLCELYLPSSQGFIDEYGDWVCPVGQFDLRIEGKLLVVNGDYYLDLEGKR